MLKQDMEDADRKQMKIARLIDLMSQGDPNEREKVCSEFCDEEYAMFAEWILENIDEINGVVKGW